MYRQHTNVLPTRIQSMPIREYGDDWGAILFAPDTRARPVYTAAHLSWRTLQDWLTPPLQNPPSLKLRWTGAFPPFCVVSNCSPSQVQIQIPLQRIIPVATHLSWRALQDWLTPPLQNPPSLKLRWTGAFPPFCCGSNCSPSQVQIQIPLQRAIPVAAHLSWRALQDSNLRPAD